MNTKQKLLGIVAAALLCITGAAHAFMPAGGVWGGTTEGVGAPGRGFQLEVENGILVLTYYGYRHDGTSTFYLAVGPIVNNTFSAELMEYSGGKPLGEAYKPAAALGSAGVVTLTFTSGLHGTATFPGESPMVISKIPVAYPLNPDGLLGTWQMTYWMSASFDITQKYRLDTKLGSSTPSGNGIVTNSTLSVACEYLVAGTFAGTVLCTEVIGSLPDFFNFEFSGDHGAGVGGFSYSDGSLSNEYEAYVVRIATSKGVKTGLTDGTLSSLTTMAASSAKAEAMTTAKELASADALSEETDLSRAAKQWREEVIAIINQTRN